VRPGHHWHRVEIEVLQRLARQQLRVLEVTFDSASIALGDLVFGQRHQQACRRPAFRVGSLGEAGPDLLDGGQPQIVEQQRQAGGVDVETHAATSVAMSSRAS
jgi:hypothetical protein